MGVLNVTPDSFSDGGRFDSVSAAYDRALQLFEDGAGMVDIGGESTRPGASPVSVQEELDRVIPVIEAIRKTSDGFLSVDTSNPEVMKAAVSAGADMINDIRALTRPDALSVAVDLAVPVCLMHMQGTPGDMQDAPKYGSVVEDVFQFLAARKNACINAGLAEENFILDPGFGFGKTLGHNLDLLANLSQFHQLGSPVLVGVSRKSMFGQLLGRPVDDRLAGTVAATVIAAQQGCAVIRVHDVKESVDAIKLVVATREYRNG
ncbi:MAG: dihydropteroate synthase [Gammaproteobacteria bacterium]|nr:MAG: dihydropteroate synthase [Gammaproteobacteria bacterium]